ncbi:hypothetical protein ABT369_39345 [Dactylosporangium sp. NPDC000244]|uniref:hypothetical protein n=1 Tax=Dactylosporangium sp. NPDC000244 TaxID=3154365 RepID=UPI00332F222B
MIDPISAGVAVGLLSAGWLLGRHARLKAAPRQPKPVCMCGHHYGTHDPQQGCCEAQDLEKVNFKDVWVDCACVRYTGPQPVEQFWVPPAADMTIVAAPRPVEGGEGR